MLDLRHDPRKRGDEREVDEIVQQQTRPGKGAIWKMNPEEQAIEQVSGNEVEREKENEAPSGAQPVLILIEEERSEAMHDSIVPQRNSSRQRATVYAKQIL
jgi:hypothetical protein